MIRGNYMSHKEFRRSCYLAIAFTTYEFCSTRKQAKIRAAKIYRKLWRKKHD